MVKSSLLGLVDVYNLLPQYAIDATNVNVFQRRLQEMLCEEAICDTAGWQNMFSPRKWLWNNRLNDWTNYKGGAATVAPQIAVGSLRTAAGEQNDFLANASGASTYIGRQKYN